MAKIIKWFILIFSSAAITLIVFLLILLNDDGCDAVGNVELPGCIIDN